MGLCSWESSKLNFEFKSRLLIQCFDFFFSFERVCFALTMFSQMFRRNCWFFLCPFCMICQQRIHCFFFHTPIPFDRILIFGSLPMKFLLNIRYLILNFQEVRWLQNYTQTTEWNIKKFHIFVNICTPRHVLSFFYPKRMRRKQRNGNAMNI